MKTKLYQDLVKLNYLCSEIDAEYHMLAQKLGLSDSAMTILYTLYQLGDGCTQSDICHLSGISKQTIHSAMHKLEREQKLYLMPGKGRDMQICLTPSGKQLLTEKIEPLISLENAVFDELDQQEREEILRLNKQYLELFRKKSQELTLLQTETGKDASL